MLPVLEFDWLLLGKAEISLVDQGGALQGVVGTLLPQVVMGEAVQFLVDEGH